MCVGQIHVLVYCGTVVCVQVLCTQCGVAVLQRKPNCRVVSRVLHSEHVHMGPGCGWMSPAISSSSPSHPAGEMTEVGIKKELDSRDLVGATICTWLPRVASTA